MKTYIKVDALRPEEEIDNIHSIYVDQWAITFFIVLAPFTKIVNSNIISWLQLILFSIEKSNWKFLTISTYYLIESIKK